MSVHSAAGAHSSHYTDGSASVASTASYKNLHDGYTRRLLNGRHPRSFPKQSELWSHYRASTKRLDRISKGHRLWHIVDKQDSPEGDWDEDWEGLEPEIRYDNEDSHPVAKGGLKDLGVDLDASTRLHYGMVIVIVNSNEELVCVNEFNETMVKKLEDMTPLNHFLFKLVDLGDPTYPGPLVYSRPVWLQVFKRGEVDNSLQFGQLIGGKLYAPPTMTSAQLEEQARVENLKRAEEDRVSRSVLGGSSPPKELSGSASTEILIGRRRRTSSGATTSSVGGGIDIDIENTRKPARKCSAAAAKAMAAQAPDQPDVCGGISVINIMGGKSHGAEKTDEAGSRHRTRSSWHLGQWVVRNAARKEVSEGRNKEGQISSDANVYLEQDLYCLASSAGSTFAPWPKRAHSPHSERYRKKADRMNPAKSDRELSSTQEKQAPTELMSQIKEFAKTDDALPVDLNSLLTNGSNTNNSRPPGTPDSGMTSLSSIMPMPSAPGGVGGGGTTAKRGVLTSTKDEVFGCLRKVVLRGPPYFLIVDRKCVWRLCPANNFGDTNELSAKEKIAHKLLRSAEEGLDQSRKGREGGRVHDKISYEGHPLHGGEKFPRQLRSILSEHAFSKESQQLNLRRKQEKLIESHFHGLYGDGSGWPDGHQFPSPLPKPSRHSPPVSPGSTGSFYVTDGGGSSDAKPQTLLKSSRQSSGSGGRAKVHHTSSAKNMKEDITYGAEMLRLHRSLHAANTKLISTLSSPNPPATPFTATFGYAGELATASIVPTATTAVGGGRTNSISHGNSNGRRQDSHDDLISLGYGQSRDKDKNGANTVETALAMGRMSKRLEKLGEVDEVVNQALRHRERIEKYGRIAAVFKNLASSGDNTKHKHSSINEGNFIPDINIDGYDPTCGT